ncbi:hypothetical protein NP493_5898g00006 [Ridgeia piscesae]|uniref:Uncharacterized protein n=3 Tax=Ridgeia piscesae TaxID=27915 RepID=A0AAD9MRC6_RIDPI|nr:hypothetical protein NP493_5898g00006 [Ridgeia piscesae]
MGKVYSSFIKRPIRNWNVGSRAQRVISQEKPQSAPRHKSTEKMIQEFTQEHPELLDIQSEKDEKLLARLIGANVVPEKIQFTATPRPLPENRRPVDDLEYGYLEPAVVPVGRCSLRQALEFIAQHDRHSENYTTELIARDFKLDKLVVSSVLKHFHMLLLQVPSTSAAHNLLKAAADAEKEHKASLTSESTAKRDPPADQPTAATKPS